MSTTDEYLKRAEECERLAAECQSDSNREIFRVLPLNGGASQMLQPVPPH